MNSYRLIYFLRPEPFSNEILNVHNITKSQDGFKVMSFPHNYCNTYHANIICSTKFKVENILFTCNCFILYLFWINNI